LENDHGNVGMDLSGHMGEKIGWNFPHGREKSIWAGEIFFKGAKMADLSNSNENGVGAMIIDQGAQYSPNKLGQMFTIKRK
jgi:hypothetical protein